MIDKLKAAGQWIHGLIGNKGWAAAGVFVFIGVVALLASRCAKAEEIDLRAGVSFGPGGSGPVLGLNLYHDLGNEVYLYGGTLLWGKTSVAENNWDWHGGMRVCRWQFCANLGASFLQRTDGINGTHTNYNLEFSWRPGWGRLASIDVAHLSNAGTTPINLGRNAALGAFRLL